MMHLSSIPSLIPMNEDSNGGTSANVGNSRDLSSVRKFEGFRDIFKVKPLELVGCGKMQIVRIVRSFQEPISPRNDSRAIMRTLRLAPAFLYDVRLLGRTR